MRFALLLACVAAPLAATAVAASRPTVIPIDAARLQQALEAAPPHSVLMADRARPIEVSRTVRVEKPVTLLGLNLRLKSGLAKTPILAVLAEEVRIRDFVLEGNGDSVPQADRAPLIVVRRSRFVIENGQTNNSAKDGVMITPVAEFGDIEHGTIRNLTGRDTIRDIVSIGGRGHEGLYVRHLVVQNIRSYGSKLRGPVEVSDGSEHITVRGIYAEGSFYGVDVQDHSRPGMVNRHIVIEGVHVQDCVTAVRTANRDFGHDGLTIRDVTGEAWREDDRWRPLHVRNTRNVLIENIRIQGSVGGPAVFVQNSDNVTLRNVTILDSAPDGAAVVVEDARNASIDNIAVIGDRPPAVAVAYRIRADERFGHLRIRNVTAPDAREAGIALENLSRSGGLDSYAITGNLATLQGELPAAKRLVGGNL